ncbi:MAG: hypothetical protein FWH08_06420 [Oscillospiraceae bacterium]|nr:hypothetical protein [Oscillospiraceae bacterium]
MLKGVNKLIIEVSNPESDFFERAIFFVKPEKSNIVTKEMNRNVQDIMGKACDIEPKKTKNKKSRALLKFAGAAGAGAAVAGVLLKLLG